MKLLKKSNLLFLFIFFTFVAQSQIVEEFQLNFETGKFDLTPIHKKKIDSIVGLLVNIPAGYKASIVGHTDSTGSLKINNTISLNRADEVAQYLSSKGFIKSKLIVSARSFFDPLNTNKTDQGKQSNRRVSIAISLDPPHTKQIAGFAPKGEKFNVYADSGKVIRYQTGSVLLIPPYAFVDSAGKRVTGPIEVYYQEYHNSAQYATSDILLSHVNEVQDAHFNTSGVYKLQAFQNGKELKLNPNQKIKSALVLNDKPSGLNAYHLNTETDPDGIWKEYKKLSGALASGKKMKSFNIDDPSLKLNNPKDKKTVEIVEESIFPTDTCDVLIWIKQSGKRFTDSTMNNTAIIKDSVRIQPITDSLNLIGTELERVKAELKENSSTYIMKKVTKESTVFTIELYSFPANAPLAKVNKIDFKNTPTNEKDELEAYKGVQWLVDTKLNMKFKPTSFKRIWKSCEIINNGENYTINLVDSLGLFTMKNVELFFPYKIKKKAKAAKILAMQDMYNEKRPENDRLRKGLEESKNKLQADYSRLQKRKEEIASMDVTKIRDSLNFLWKNIKPYMNEGEDALSFDNWVLYLDSNKSLMRDRFQLLATSQRCVACDSLTALREQLNKQHDQLAEVLKTSIGDRFQELIMTKTGVYSCSKIVELENAQTIFATYKDKSGAKVDVLSTYLFDNTINGYITYNGYMDYGPNKFAFNPQSVNRLLVFDIKGNAYLAKPDQFKSIKTGENIKASFTVEKISNLKDEKSLNDLLGGK